jgi:hypothetical protein
MADTGEIYLHAYVENVDKPECSEYTQVLVRRVQGRILNVSEV